MENKKYLIFFSCIILFVSLGPGLVRSSDARPLRLWFLPNMVLSGPPPVDPQEIERFIEATKARGIIIENTPADLAIETDVNKSPKLIQYIQNNFFLDQLEEFVKTENDGEPVSIEFIRWYDGLHRLTEASEYVTMETAPDVIHLGSTWLASLAGKGALMDVDGYFDKGEFFRPSIDSVTPDWKEGMYAAPWYVDTRVIYYHRDLIDDEHAFDNMDSFYDLCRRWGTKTPSLIAFPTAVMGPLLFNLAPWIWAYGGDIITTDTAGPVKFPRVKLGEQPSFEALKYLHNISAAGCADFVDLSTKGLDDHFMAGKSAAIISGVWLVRKLGPNWQDRYAMKALPAGPNGSVSFVGGSHLGIFRDAKSRSNFEKAVRFIRFMTSDRIQYQFAVESGIPPARRTALAEYSKFVGTDVFWRSLEGGRSFPSIPEYSEIVERDIIRDHMWHLWRQIASRQPPQVLMTTVNEAALEMKKRLIIATFRRYSTTGTVLVAGLVFIFGLTHLRTRRRYVRLLAKNDEISEAFRRTNARHTLLEGKILTLGRQRAIAADRSVLLAGKLDEYQKKSADLRCELEKIEKKRKDLAQGTLGDFFIRWNGVLNVEGKEVAFDNALQARRVFCHIARLPRQERHSVHCLAGFCLFDWGGVKFKSDPNRLFNTAVSKINGPLKKLGLPPLLESDGKGSLCWRLVWDAMAIAERSEAGMASEICLAARRLSDTGDKVPGIEKALSALETDPQCEDAYALLSEMKWNELEIAADLKLKVKNSLKRGTDIVRDELERLEKGLAALDDNATSLALKYPAQSDKIHNEAALLKSRGDNLRDIYTYCLGGQGDDIPPRLKNLFDRLRLAGQTVTDIKSRKTPRHVIWGEIVGSESFLSLTAMPKINSIINNFHNRDIGAMEDPRLVKLAIAWMLEHDDTIGAICSARNEEDFTLRFKTSIHKQMKVLETELSLMPDL